MISGLSSSPALSLDDARNQLTFPPSDNGQISQSELEALRRAIAQGLDPMQSTTVPATAVDAPTSSAGFPTSAFALGDASGRFS